MPKIRVLIVDDSTVIRRLLSDTLASDAELEVAATAPNGKIALAKIPQVNPDVITLDMEMPEMDGLQTLTAIRQQYPKLPVIMFSTLTQRGAEQTFDALAKGASDYVTKPANVGSITDGIRAIQQQLIPKIKGLCHRSPATPAQMPRVGLGIKQQVQAPPARIDIVAIGVSTGGPNALASVLPQLPESFPVPIVIVQHMPPVFTQHLATRLNQISPLQVKEAKAGDVLLPASVWIAPGDFHLTLRRTGNQIVAATDQGTPENSCRPAVDVLFRSCAQLFGTGVLAVVLTGMGQDGLRGCEVVRQAGGRVFVQDQATSVVWGMPGSVSQAGLAHQTLPLFQIPSEILREVQRFRTTQVA